MEEVERRRAMISIDGDLTVLIRNVHMVRII
jgi:hypothetical protein